MMKIRAIVLILLLCGCIGFPYVSAESVEIPDLTGNWTGLGSGYYDNPQGGFFNETMEFNYSLSIVEQHENVFNGTMQFVEENYNSTFTFSGIIDHDMKTLYLAEKGTGMDIAHLISPTEIEFIGLDLQNGTSVIINFTKES